MTCLKRTLLMCASPWQTVLNPPDWDLYSIRLNSNRSSPLAVSFLSVLAKSRSPWTAPSKAWKLAAFALAPASSVFRNCSSGSTNVLQVTSRLFSFSAFSRPPSGLFKWEYPRACILARASRASMACCRSRPVLLLSSGC